MIERRRHLVPLGGLTWEVEVFAGAHAGPVRAGIELPAEDAPFARRDWLGREVTGERRTYNASLALERPDADAARD